METIGNVLTSVVNEEGISQKQAKPIFAAIYGQASDEDKEEVATSYGTAYGLDDEIATQELQKAAQAKPETAPTAPKGLPDDISKMIENLGKEEIENKQEAGQQIYYYMYGETNKIKSDHEVFEGIKTPQNPQSPVGSQTLEALNLQTTITTAKS